MDRQRSRLWWILWRLQIYRWKIDSSNASDYVSQERKDILKELHDALNPVLLHNKKQKLFEQIDLANKELQKGNCSTRLLTLPPIPNEFLIYERKLKAIYEQNRGKIKLYKS